MDKQLFAAASEGDLELVKNLLTQGADKEYIDDEVSQVIYFYLCIDNWYYNYNNKKQKSVYDDDNDDDDMMMMMMINITMIWYSTSINSNIFWFINLNDV